MQRAISAGLGCELPSGGLIADEVGTEDLGDDHAEESVVPGEVRLVASSSAQEAHREATGSDLLTLVEPPLRPGLSHGNSRHGTTPFLSSNKKVRDAGEAAIRRR